MTLIYFFVSFRPKLRENLIDRDTTASQKRPNSRSWGRDSEKQWGKKIQIYLCIISVLVTFLVHLWWPFFTSAGRSRVAVLISIIITVSLLVVAALAAYFSRQKVRQKQTQTCFCFLCRQTDSLLNFFF